MYTVQYKVHLHKNYNSKVLCPTPLLVQRCNCTSAGLGYLEVMELSMEILLG
jgi:hypothetical protein